MKDPNTPLDVTAAWLSSILEAVPPLTKDEVEITVVGGDTGYIGKACRVSCRGQAYFLKFRPAKKTTLYQASEKLRLHEVEVCYLLVGGKREMPHCPWHR
jgi:hypothetical protein